jgi:hypothetical protein
MLEAASCEKGLAILFWAQQARCDNVNVYSFRARDSRIRIEHVMNQEHPKSWLRHRVETALVRGLTRAYETVKVDPAKFLLQLRAAYDLPITSSSGTGELYSEGYWDPQQHETGRCRGAGFRLGGIITIVLTRTFRDRCGLSRN